MHWNALQCTAVRCNAIQYNALQCTLQSVHRLLHWGLDNDTKSSSLVVMNGCGMAAISASHCSLGQSWDNAWWICEGKLKSVRKCVCSFWKLFGWKREVGLLDQVCELTIPITLVVSTEWLDGPVVVGQVARSQLYFLSSQWLQLRFFGVTRSQKN